MTTTTFTDLITDESQLRDVFGWPSARAVNKQIDHLDRHCRAIIAKSPFLLLGTSDTTGRCDVSPKGDYPGFVRVLDEKTIAIPDSPRQQSPRHLDQHAAQSPGGLAVHDSRHE